MPAHGTAAAVIDDFHPEGIIGEGRPDIEIGVGVDDPVGD